ncbi:MAG TPA: FixH family protein [Alphaproteobacteria bacterium]|nr:FixH family protein [Alphaproteobacteria bacterium]
MRAGEFHLKGWHVLAMLVAFFGVVFAVNGVFIYYALRTHPGDDVQDAYVAGVEYNRELAEKREQRKLGWQASLSVKADARNGEFIEVAFVDAKGEPVLGLKVDAMLRSPVVASQDRPLKFVSTGPGRFRADVNEPPAAQWDLIIEARNDFGEVFRLRHRL